MITDKQSIRLLQFRSDLPRFPKDNVFIFAQLEPEEQKLSESKRTQLILQTYAQFLEDPSTAMLFDDQLKSVRPLAYKLSADTEPNCEILECLYHIEGDRHPYTLGKMRIYQKAFVYFFSDLVKSISESHIPQDRTHVS